MAFISVLDHGLGKSYLCRRLLGTNVDDIGIGYYYDYIYHYHTSTDTFVG
jgi:hypothetical protein